MHATRLPLIAEDLRSRLQAYPAAFEPACRSFGGLAIDAFLLGVTGASYAAGVEGDQSHCAQLARALDRPVATASLAIVQALRALDCRSITLVSPYPDWLTRQSVGYWQSAGIQVQRIESLGETFRAYEMSSDEVQVALQGLCQNLGDAVLIAGTGLASLTAITAEQPHMAAPLLSSNLCAAWWATKTLGLPASAALRAAAPALAALS